MAAAERQRDGVPGELVEPEGRTDFCDERSSQCGMGSEAARRIDFAESLNNAPVREDLGPRRKAWRERMFHRGYSIMRGKWAVGCGELRRGE